MIIVTGGAGFIGSCIVAFLNQKGFQDIMIVDDLYDGVLKDRNLEYKKFNSLHDKKEFLSLIMSDAIDKDVSAVIHMGACSSTTGTNRDYYMENNYEYSKKVALWALKKKARFIYASSAATYGAGENGYKDGKENISKCKPLNFYGESKQLFDEWIIKENLYDHVVGLKFFNVFGPNEQHKADMQSVISKAYQYVNQYGKMELFKSHIKEYADGEQKRDFIYVKDVVKVVYFLLHNHQINGIYNLGTGQARSWNDLAKALFGALNKQVNISYVDMPIYLRDKYQYFTQAEMTSLRKAGYQDSFMSLEEAVKDYIQYLKQDKRW